MREILCLIFGIIISYLFVIFILPKQKLIRVIPDLDNYKDTIYVDENGVLYQYDVIELVS